MNLLTGRAVLYPEITMPSMLLVSSFTRHLRNEKERDSFAALCGRAQIA